MTELTRKWPKLHRGFALRDELLAWSIANANGPEYELRSNPSDTSNPMVISEWRVKRGTLPDYEHAALLVGDIIHNWRCALDHQMWAITPETERSRRGTQVQFPIHHKESDYGKWRKAWQPFYGEKVLAVIEDAQPCRVPNGKIHPLGLLQVLSNQDKHRLPTVMAHVAVDVAPVVVEPEPAGGVDCTTWTGPVQDETILASIRFARPVGGGGHEVVVRPTFAFAQQVRLRGPFDAADQWHDLGDLMNALGSLVVQTVGYLYNAHRLDSGLPQDA